MDFHSQALPGGYGGSDRALQLARLSLSKRDEGRRVVRTEQRVRSHATYSI